MKKILPYFLIVLIVLQLLAPFTISGGVKNNIEIQKNTVEASDTIKVTANAYKTDKTIRVEVRVAWGEAGWRTGGEGVIVTLLDASSPAKVLDSKRVELEDIPKEQWKGDELSAEMVQEGSYTFNQLRPETTYGINTVALHSVISWWEMLTSSIGTPVPPMPELSTSTVANPNPLVVITNSSTNQTEVSAGQQVAANDNAMLPVCELMSAGTWGGCIGRLLYWAVFQPTSYIFGLTGRLLDVSVDYSTKDTSYRSDFVVEGWGVVRDFCNMFFIFILLYIAFGTILNIHSVKTKEMIINVVIIGLLMNFSLFATQVIIDASNILTRVFYNSNSITVGPMIDGVIQDQRGTQGEIKLSEALIAKINPQQLLLQPEKASSIETKFSTGQEQKDTNGINVTTFILVTILASIINVVGIITFLTSSLIFIARVIGLWLAMVFAPLAFFSYTVPAMQDWGVVGWKKWWPETIKLAFLAPVFVFFIYLIIKFLNTGLGLVVNDDRNGLDFILGIFVPFIFIMILLTKAKDIAKSMSGQIGQSVTNGIAAVGGIALGGAALGAAALGRKFIGETAARASRGDTLSQRYMDPNKRNNMNWLQKSGGWVSSGFGTGKGTNVIHDKIGAKVNEKQKKVGEVDHARHVMDETKNKAGYGNVDYDRLSKLQRDKVRETFIRENKNKWAKDVEDQYRKDKKYTDKKALTPAETTELKQRINDKAAEEFGHELKLASEKIKGFERAISQVNTGTMDVRNLSTLRSDKREGFFTKLPVGLIAGVATGVRAGIKNIGLSHGGIKVEGSFMKDLGNTISDSLKSMKINVKIDDVGEHHSSADAHGGGHH